MGTDRSVAVLGAGAVGGYLGARLALSDANLHVTLIGRARVVEAVRKRGVIVRETPDKLVAHPEATTWADSVEPADVVVLAVRTYDVVPAIPDLQRVMGDTGIALAFQNGVGTDEMLMQHVGSGRLLAATLTVSVAMEEPAEITRHSRGGGVALASMDGRAVPEWIVRAFSSTGLPTVVIADYRSLRWSKLLLNMLGAATTAILDTDISTVMDNPRLFRVEQLAFREAGRVMDSLNIRAVQLPGYPVPLARRIMRLPRPIAQRLLGRRIASARSGRSPSMRSDIHRGKTEVAAFNGAIADAGARAGIRTPVNGALAELAMRLAEHPEDRETFRGMPENVTKYLEDRGIPANL